MTQPRNRHKPNNVAPYSYSKPIQTGFNFVFSDKIEHWIRSGKVTTKEYKMAPSRF
jgi:hypothetical protein